MRGMQGMQRLLLGALLIFLPWREGGADPLGLLVAHTLVFALLGVALLLRLREGRFVVSAGWEAMAAAALVAVCAVSSSRAGYLFGTALASWEVLVTALLALALLVAREDPGRTAMWLVSASSSLQAIEALAARPSTTLSQSASFVNANDLAAYLNIGILVSAGLALSAWRQARGTSDNAAWGVVALPCAVLVLDLAALLSLGSRGALIALGAASTAWILLAVPPGRLRHAALAALAIVLMAGVAGVVSRFSRIADPYRLGRLAIWKAGLEASADNPVLGIGPGMFQRRGYQYNFPLDGEMFRYSKLLTSTHSTYLQALVETGLAGAAALAVFLLGLGRRSWEILRHHPRPEPAVAGAIMAATACLVHGVVDTPFDVPAITLSIVALIVPIVGRRETGRADLYWSPGWRRTGGTLVATLVVAGSLATSFAAGVLLPWAAHRSFELGNLDRAVELNRYNPLYPAARAGASWRVDRMLEPEIMAAADRDLQVAHGLDPGNPDHLRSLGRLHAHAIFEFGATDSAIRRAEEYYRRALALGVRDPRYHLEAASFFHALGRNEESLALAGEALALEPRFLAAGLLRVRVLLGEGRREEAGVAMRDLDARVSELRSYVPKNGYEADLVRVDPGQIEDLRNRLR